MEQKQIKFFTTDGSDVWVFEKYRTMVDLRNADTGKTVTCEKGDPRFCPAEIKIRPVRKYKTPDKRPKTVKTKTPGVAGKKSKYKGVRPEGRKFSGQYWDKTEQKLKYLGMFEAELLAAAAVQEALGNKKEAIRLREEYQEGDQMPEGPASGAEKSVGTAENKGKGAGPQGALIEELKGPVTYMCAGCGQSYEKKTLKCVKCGSCAIEPVRLAAAAAQHARKL